MFIRIFKGGGVHSEYLLDLIAPPPTPWGRSSILFGETFAKLVENFASFRGRPLLPSGETLAALEQTLNPIGETFAPL